MWEINELRNKFQVNMGFGKRSRNFRTRSEAEEFVRSQKEEIVETEIVETDGVDALYRAMEAANVKTTEEVVELVDEETSDGEEE